MGSKADAAMAEAKTTSSSLFFEAIARKIEADPELLRIPLENIERWLAGEHTAAHRLREWQRIILRATDDSEGLTELLALLRADDESSLHLKSFDPFPGILTSKERQEILLQCAYAH
jgi:hypothetical protein